MEKELILARKDLAISAEWREIKKNLYEEIKLKACYSSTDGEFIKGMLKTIDIVDSWKEDFLKIKRKEEKELN